MKLELLELKFIANSFQYGFRSDFAQNGNVKGTRITYIDPEHWIMIEGNGFSRATSSTVAVCPNVIWPKRNWPDVTQFC